MCQGALKCSETLELRYAHDWNAASYAPGTHQPTVQATGLAGDVSTKTLTVTVAAPSAR